MLDITTLDPRTKELEKKIEVKKVEELKRIIEEKKRLVEEKTKQLRNIEIIEEKIKLTEDVICLIVNSLFIMACIHRMLLFF